METPSNRSIIELDEGMTAMQERLDTIQETQNQTNIELAKLSQHFESFTQQLTQQMQAMNQQISELNQWRNSIPDMYVPRREHDARAHEPRIVALEEERLARLRRESEAEARLQIQIQAIVKEFLEKQMTMMQHNSQQNSEQDNRWTEKLLMLLLFGINLLVGLSTFALTYFRK